MTRFAAVMVVLLLSIPGYAHEIRPAYLDIREMARDEFAVVWKVPAQGEMRLGLYVSLPESCAEKTEPVGEIEGGAYLERWTVVCTAGLKNQEIAIVGLNSTMTEALVRVEYGNSETEVVRLMPDSPSFTATGSQTSLMVAKTYFILGIDHILSGLDHLIFVLALMLLIRDRWRLIETITAFTVAHSITLAGASLGYFSLPQKPVEATIALSIAFVASELVRMKPGERRLSESYPWIVAFAFGLLHGFGFAGALKEIGLPQSDVPLSLLLFNLGVEAGQLIFVAVALIVFWVVGLLSTMLSAVTPVHARLFGAYMIGTASIFWLISRVAGLAA